MRNLAAERTLIDRMQAGDGTAVSDLAAAYGPKIQQLAFRYTKNREDAEEVAQDVLLKVYQKIRGFRGDAALSSWIYRITFNTAMSRLRTVRTRRPENSAEWTGSDGPTERAAREVVDWSPLADEEVLRQELKRELIKALQTLPPIYRIPVILRDIEGLSTEEASALVGVKTQTLKSRLHRGRLILRDRLQDFAVGLSLRRAA